MKSGDIILGLNGIKRPTSMIIQIVYLVLALNISLLALKIIAKDSIIIDITMPVESKVMRKLMLYHSF